MIYELKTNPLNPRSIKKEQFEKLKKSLAGFLKMLEVRPIAYDEDKIVWGGNMRLEALRALVNDGTLKEEDLKPEYFKELVGYTLNEKKEFAIKDNNPTGLSGNWDDDILANEWSDLPLDDWGIDTSGWSAGEVVEDGPPAVEEGEPVSVLGEVYRLGNHRLMCGDATKVEDVEKLMNGEKADMVFTDPPYNIDYEGKTKKRLKIENDKKSGEEFYQFLYDSLLLMNAFSKAGAPIYVCHADSERINFNRAMTDAGWLQKQCIIWDKGSMVLGRQDYHWEHEPILYGWKEGQAHQFYGGRDKTTIWRIPRPTRSEEHPTMKPIKLCATAIQNSSKGDDIVMDLFGGSGSTLIACEQTNRICYMMELDPHYCDVIRKRYHKFVTGSEEGWQGATPVI